MKMTTQEAVDAGDCRCGCHVVSFGPAGHMCVCLPDGLEILLPMDKPSGAVSQRYIRIEGRERALKAQQKLVHQEATNLRATNLRAASPLEESAREKAAAVQARLEHEHRLAQKTYLEQAAERERGVAALEKLDALELYTDEDLTAMGVPDREALRTELLAQVPDKLLKKRRKKDAEAEAAEPAGPKRLLRTYRENGHEITIDLVTMETVKIEPIITARIEAITEPSFAESMIGVRGALQGMSNALRVQPLARAMKGARFHEQIIEYRKRMP